MNREEKRRYKRDQKAMEKAMKSRRKAATAGAPRERVGMGQFIREIRAELRRVIWPTRNEVFTYSAVVLFVVLLLTGLVFVLDIAFSRAVLFVFDTAEPIVSPAPEQQSDLPLDLTPAPDSSPAPEGSPSSDAAATPNAQGN